MVMVVVVCVCEVMNLKEMLVLLGFSSKGEGEVKSSPALSRCHS